MKERVQKIIDRISINLFGQVFKVVALQDQIFPNNRIFLQVSYSAPDSFTGKEDTWRGRKWYLSEYMTDDEIIKTAYAAFEACIKHEVMENFKVDNITLFNPHINFEELLKISHKQVKRNAN